jgi:hypothetical protein
MVIRLFEICFHFAGHRSSTQEFSAGRSEFLSDLHFLCKIVLKPSNVWSFLKHYDRAQLGKLEIESLMTFRQSTFCI